MQSHPYDRSGKWLIEHHGDSILRLAGIRRIVDWRPVPGEVVQPLQLPDGLLDGPSLEFKLELAPLCVQWPETAHRAT
jgi:hypothetical protein